MPLISTFSITTLPVCQSTAHINELFQVLFFLFLSILPCFNFLQLIKEMLLPLIALFKASCYVKLSNVIYNRRRAFFVQRKQNIPLRTWQVFLFADWPNLNCLVWHILLQLSLLSVLGAASDNPSLHMRAIK